jgi:ribonuclease-3
MVMGEGEFRSGGHRRASILADAMEALLGAIFVDGGYSASRAVIRELFDPLISGMPPAEELKDAKTRLQEWLQARGRPLPEYRLVREEGADHAKKFFVRVRLPDDGMEAEESGRSRRKAEQAAAARALDTLQASA